MEFIKHDARKLKRVGSSWRLPRGKKNRDRLQRRGHRKLPQEGFKSNKAVRFKIKDKVPVLVYSLSDLEKVNDKNIVILSSALGERKRAAILKICGERGIEVVNHGVVKDAEKNSK